MLLFKKRFGLYFYKHSFSTNKLYISFKLLWIGAILCYIAYSVDYFTLENPAADNLYLGVSFFN